MGHHKVNKELDSLIHTLENYDQKDSIKANLIYEIGYLSYINDLEYTKDLALELEILSNEINYPIGLIKSYNLMGIYYDNTEEYEKAIDSYQKALELSEKHHYPKGASSAVNNLGIIYEILGEYPKALNYYHQSLTLDNQQKDTLSKAKTLMQMGCLYEYMGDTTKALYHYEQSLGFSQAVGNEMLISYNQLNIGYLLLKKGDAISARGLFNEAMEVSKTKNRKEGILLSYLMIGIVDKEEKKYIRAIENFNASKEICKETGCVSYQRYANFHLADSYFRLGHLDKAFDLAKKTYNSNDFIDKSLQITTVQLLSEIKAAQGKFKEAYEYHKEFKELHDKSFNESNLRKISQLEYENKLKQEKHILELEQQKQEAVFQSQRERQLLIRNFILVLLGLSIVLLISIFNNGRNRRKANEILSQQKKELEEANQKLKAQKTSLEKATNELEIANQTKDKFFSIIAHDLRSPFSSIFGFSDLLLDSYKEFDEEEMELFLKKIKSGSESALMLLENLFSWASSNSGTIKFQPEVVPLKDVADSVVSIYETAANDKGVKLMQNISLTDEVYADLDMLRTILRNLVSNAIKFTNKGDQIEINFDSDQEFSIIKVKDTGVGIETDKLESIFQLSSKVSTLGTSGEKGSGLGLVLCKEFAEKHQGKIEVKSEVGKGTEISVSFPHQTIS